MARPPKSEPDETSDAGVEDVDDHDSGLRQRIESLMPEMLKRAMLSGLGAISMTEESIRGAVTEMRLPKEAVGFLVDQADSTKDQFLALLAREIREHLASADLGAELAKALSTMTIDIQTSIKFVPDEGGSARPDVKSSVGITRRRKKRRKSSD